MMNRFFFTMLFLFTFHVHAEEKPKKLIDPSCLITAESIAGIKPGDTLKTLQGKIAKIGDGLTVKNFDRYMVDFSAVGVFRDEELLFYAVFYEGEHKKPSSKIEILETTNPRFRMANGVGPGMLVSTAEKIMGEATLGYNTENESREVLSFAGKNAPPRNVFFRAQTPSLGYGFAGIYKESNDSYVETKEYHPLAYIQRVSLSAPFPKE